MADKNCGVKKRQGNSGRISKEQPKYTPYIVAVGVLIIAVAVSSIVFPKLGMNEKRLEAASTGRPIAELEALMRQLSNALGAVAGKGRTGVFKQLQAIADAAHDVVASADAATTDDERREILEAGLAAKSEWLALMAEQAGNLRAEDERDRKENALLKPDSSGDVVVLTKDTFPEYLRDHPYAMVEFYAPWCGHCKKLAPEYEECAQQLKGRAGFAAVDATSESELARIYKVGGYPTLKWFVRGRPIDYLGPRTAEGISSWVEGRLQPAYADIEATDDLSEALESTGGSTAICAVTAEKHSKLFQAFEAAAEQLRGKKLLFLWTSSGPGSSEAIMLHKLGSNPEPCVSSVGTCQTADEIIDWLSQAWSAEELKQSGLGGFAFAATK